MDMLPHPKGINGAKKPKRKKWLAFLLWLCSTLILINIYLMLQRRAPDIKARRLSETVSQVAPEIVPIPGKRPKDE